jgi:3-oxoacyl-[acyl-carrier protein] reductase
VTGAAGGLGRAIVAELAAAGVQVGACDLPEALAGGAAAGAAASAGFDLRDADAVRRGVAEISAALGGLDAVVANAGVVDTVHRADRFPLEAWQGDLDTNLTGQFLLAQAAWPDLRASAKAGGSPAIVFVSSAAAELGLPGQAAYAAAKAGVAGLGRTLAAEWGPRGVRVNVVMPGMIGTPKVRALPPPVLDALCGQVPLGRVGEPAEVAAAIAFLLGPAGGYVHGQVLRVDGGLGLSTQSLAVGSSEAGG